MQVALIPMKNPKDTEIFVICKDHTVSGELFSLLHGDNRDMLITSPQPLPDELMKYYQSDQYISHTDSNKGILNTVYQWVKAYMLSQKLNWLKDFKSEGRLLDIGAGTGEFLLAAKNRGWEVLGTEPSSQARELALKKGITLKKEDFYFNSNTFDVITMWHVLEHVSDLHNQVKELKRMLRPGGLLIIAVPNYRSYDAEVYSEYWAGYDVPRHLWHFSKQSIERIFGKNGFSLVQERPLQFDAYYVSLLSEKYKSGRWKPFSAFRTGFKSNQQAKTNGEFSSLAYFLKKED